MSKRIPEGWSLQLLGKLTDVRSSNVDKKSDSSEISVRLCNYTDVYYHSQITSDIDFMLATAKQNEIDRFSLKKGDVIITKDSETPDDIAVSSFVSESLQEVVCGYHLTLLRPNPKLSNGEFLAHQFQLSEVQHYFYLLANGTTRFGLTAEAINKAPLVTPPLPEQQKIAAILSSVDDVIEKTRAQIDKLKDLKTGMMQELLTKGIGHTEFKDSPVGRIPAAWGVCELGSIAKLERGRFSHRPRNDPQFYGGDIPFLQTGDIPKERPKITSFSQTLNEKGLKVSKLFPKGTLVITIAATIGEIGVLEFDSCFPDSLVGIKVNQKKAKPVFILYLMRHLKSELEGLAPKTAQKNINLDILQPFQVPLPELREQELIAEALSSTDTKIHALFDKFERMQNIKKALMQDLLTGKVRVNVD